MIADITIFIAIAALFFTWGSLYRARVVYEDTPRRDVVLRYFANLWQCSEEAKKDDVDNSDFLKAINEAKLLFGRKKEVVHTIDQLVNAEPENQASLIEQLAVDLANASGIRFKHLSRDLIGKPIYIRRSTEEQIPGKT